MFSNLSMITESRRRADALILRADADSRIGTGHVMRCIALGQAWQDAGGEVVFITCCENAALLQRLRDEQFTVIGLYDPAGFQSEIINLKSQITSPWLVLDGYHFGLDDQRAVRKAGYKLLLIDDYNHLPEYECDILLNQNINAAELNYKINPEARLLLGTDCTMLRREFQRLEKPAEKVPDIGNRILVTLGGADPDNMTLKVTEALQKLDVQDLHVKVIAGPANPHLQSLQKAVDLSTFDFQLLTDVRDMPGLMLWADLTVSAAGSTCWELCCLGVPFITLVLAENQSGLAEGLSERGVAICLGENPSAAQIASAVQTLAGDPAQRACCSEKGRALVDGLGVIRVLSAPAKEAGLDLFDGRLSLRPAREHDMKRLWLWANDPSVRRNSYHPEPIPFADHQKWFKKKLGSPDSLVLILMLDGIAAGQVRYDRVEPQTAEIDFSIDPEFRGLGLGARLIKLSLEQAGHYLGVRQVRAEVFQSNYASQAVFIKTGFIQTGACEIKGISSFVYMKETGSPR